LMADGASSTQWEISAKQADEELQKRKLPILSVAFNGETVLTSSSRPTVKLWRLGDEGLIANGSLTEAAAAAPSSLDAFRDMAAVCTQDGTILLCDLRNPKEKPAKLESARGQGSIIRFLADGHRLVSGNVSGRLSIWDLRQQRVERELPANSVGAVKNGDEERASKARRTSVSQAQADPDPAVTSMCASGDGRMLACGRSSGRIGLLDLATLDWAGTDLQVHVGSAVRSLSFERSKFLFSGGDDRNLCMMDASRWVTRGIRPQVERFPAHRASITCVQACPDHRHPALVSTSLDKVVKVWDYRRQRVLQTFSSHSAGVTSMAFEPDGHVFVTVGADAMIYVYAPVHDVGADVGAPASGAPQEDVKVKPG